MVGDLEEIGPKVPGAAVDEVALGPLLDVAGEEHLPAVGLGKQDQRALVDRLVVVRRGMEGREAPAAEGQPLPPREEARPRAGKVEEPPGAAGVIPARGHPDLAHGQIGRDIDQPAAMVCLRGVSART